MRNHIAALLSCALALGACATADNPTAQTRAQTERPFELRVASFPWIPDAAAYSTWIEKEFQARNPDIDLVVLPVDEAEKVNFAYNPKGAGALTDERGPDHQHLIEIDTLTLGKLVEMKAVQPFGARRTDYFPFAAQAVRINGTTYGVPH